MLVKPIPWRAEDTARRPIDSHNAIAVTAFVGARSPFAGPHQRIALGTQNNEDRSAAVVMRFVIPSHRPFAQMTDQRVIGNFELRKLDAWALLLLSVDDGLANVGNEIGFPDPLPVVGREIAAIPDLEIIAFAVVAIRECKITIEDKFFVVKMVQDHRRRRHREKKRGSFTVIDKTVRAVQGWRKKTAGLPADRMRHATALLKFHDPFTLKDVNDFFVQMLFRFRHRPGRYSACINSGDSLQTSELKISPVAPEPAPRSQRNPANVSHAKSLDDRNAFLLHPALVVGLVPRER